MYFSMFSKRLKEAIFDLRIMKYKAANIMNFGVFSFFFKPVEVTISFRMPNVHEVSTEYEIVQKGPPCLTSTELL